ncbi:hypothetical protein BGX29_010833 [Mortierella sp. GBA35]|nr:hypothetical protein BGX29_010833 [Mortierella sp. GBA35]
MAGKWIFQRLMPISNRRAPHGRIYIRWLFSTWTTSGPVKPKRISIESAVSTIKTPSNEVFGQSLTEEAKALCHLQSIDNKDDAFMEITNSLLQKQTLDEIFDETYQLQIAQPTYRRMLDYSEYNQTAVRIQSTFRSRLHRHLVVNLSRRIAFGFSSFHAPGHYHEYASQAHRVVKQYQYQKKGEDEEDAVSSTPKYGTETLEWEHVVLHTPTKASKRPSLLEKLKLAKEEGQHDWSEE